MNRSIWNRLHGLFDNFSTPISLALIISSRTSTPICFLRSQRCYPHLFLSCTNHSSYLSLSRPNDSTRGSNIYHLPSSLKTSWPSHPIPIGLAFFLLQYADYAPSALWDNILSWSSSSLSLQGNSRSTHPQKYFTVMACFSLNTSLSMGRVQSITDPYYGQLFEFL